MTNAAYPPLCGTWRCDYCHDEMDEKFKSTHTTICAMARLWFEREFALDTGQYD